MSVYNISELNSLIQNYENIKFNCLCDIKFVPVESILFVKDVLEWLGGSSYKLRGWVDFYPAVENKDGHPVVKNDAIDVSFNILKLGGLLTTRTKMVLSSLGCSILKENTNIRIVGRIKYY